MLLRTASTIEGISALVSGVWSDSSVSSSLSESRRELPARVLRRFARSAQELVFLRFVAVLLVEDVSSQERLVAPLPTLLVGSRLLVDRVATDLVGLTLMFLFPERFLVRGILLACFQTKNSLLFSRA